MPIFVTSCHACIYCIYVSMNVKTWFEFSKPMGLVGGFKTMEQSQNCNWISKCPWSKRKHIDASLRKYRVSLWKAIILPLYAKKSLGKISSHVLQRRMHRMNTKSVKLEMNHSTFFNLFSSYCNQNETVNTFYHQWFIVVCNSFCAGQCPIVKPASTMRLRWGWDGLFQGKKRRRMARNNKLWS